jgi:hypothetical protein
MIDKGKEASDILTGIAALGKLAHFSKGYTD